MPAFQYENMFIAFLWVYHTDPNVNRDTKAYLGKIDCQLTYSHNGWHFQRTLREPFIPNASPGEYGAGCVYPASLVHAGDTLRIYSSTSKGEHGQIVSDPESRQAAILLHTLRLDGFVYLEPPGGAGEMVTRLLLWGDGEPTLNVSAPQGVVRIQAMDENGTALRGYSYDDGVPFTGDSVTWTPEWRDGRKLASLAIESSG